MAVFEVFIPARSADAPNVTLTVEGRNWIEALRSGLKSIGEGGEAIANVMCDVKEDGSIHVTDVTTRRVFRLRELKDAAGASATPSSPAATAPAFEMAAPQPQPPARVPTSPGALAPGVGDVMAPSPKTMLQFKAFTPEPAAPQVMVSNIEETERMAPAAGTPARTPTPAPAAARTATPASFALAAPAPDITAPRPQSGPLKPVTPQVMDGDTAKIPVFKTVTDETDRADRTPRAASPPTPRGVPAPAPRRPSGQFALAPQPQAREESKPQPTDPKIGRATVQPVDATDAIAAVFDATQDLYLEQRLSPERVASKLLDIALAHVPAESGTFYLADVNGHELTFAAVRGPKADALKRSGMTVPLGQGIIGFCAQEGICLSVSDIKNDPRWLSSIGKKLDYLPKDTLCASAEKDGRLFGAVQLINSKNGFDAVHMEVLRYIGLTAAALLERIETAG